ncbi:MAG: helix-turn-helix domain-containing protein [Oscillospiraceae bacterium]|nr:helix-turn-helix domain-containing protein [Oscillospiraceae bacterium]
MGDYEKRGYLLENFRLFHLQTDRAPAVDFHFHEFCKLLFLVSGKGGYVVEGQRYQLQSGDIVCIDSRAVHRPEFEENTAYERIILYVDPSFLQKESTEACCLLDCFNQGHVLRLKEPARKKLFDMAANLEKELNKQEFGRDIASNAALLRLLVQIGREQRRDNALQPTPEMTQSKRTVEIMAYIDAHLAEDLNIDALAEQFYVSKFHMMRQFRRETGYSVYDYLSQRRLLQARELIQKGMRATEACYRCGFRSYSSFTRSFSKHFGSTPTGRIDSAHRRAEDYE